MVTPALTSLYQPIKVKALTITIYKENGNLYADLSNGTGKHMLLVAQTAKPLPPRCTAD